jgi:hypothetical protein
VSGFETEKKINEGLTTKSTKVTKVFSPPLAGENKRGRKKFLPQRTQKKDEDKLTTNVTKVTKSLSCALRAL